MGDHYTGMCVTGWQRLALKDIRLLHGKLYGNVYERNVRICFIDACLHTGDTDIDL